MSSNRIVDLRAKAEPTRARRPSGRPPEREQKRLPLRTRRRRARTALLFFILLCIALAAYGVHWISYAQQFSIDTVTVIGADTMPTQIVQLFTETELDDGSYHFLSRDNIFLYPKVAIEKGLVASFPRIQSAAVSRPSLFSRSLIVTIAERQSFARWCVSLPSAQASSTPAQCFQMDGSGFIFASADASTTAASSFVEPYLFSGDLSSQVNPTQSPIGQTFIPGHLPGVLALLTVLQQQDGVTPVAVTVESDQDFSVDLQDGYSLKASFGEDTGTLARNLKLALGSDALAGQQANIEYVDLRFGDKVYYKLKGESATSTAQ
jgi:cell division septal protein FtsQ